MKKTLTNFQRLVKWLEYKGEIESQTDLGNILGIPKGTFAGYLKNDNPPISIIKDIEKRFKIKSSDFEQSAKKDAEMNQEDVSVNTILNLTESNKILSEANKIQSEANKVHAEANRILAESNKRILDMLTPTVGVVPQSKADVYARCEDLLVVMADVATGKKYDNWEQAHEDLRKRFYAHVEQEIAG